MPPNIFNNSQGDNDANVALNWTSGNVPTAGDTMAFDSTISNANCILSAAISCDGITYLNAYTGTLDPATFDITLDTLGLDCTNAGSATILGGTGNTWSCSGDWDFRDLGTFTRQTSEVDLTGTARTLDAVGSNSFHNLTITGTITLISSDRIDIFNTCQVDGTATVNNTLRIIGGATSTLNNTGTINGSATIQVNNDAKILVNSGTFSVNITSSQGCTITGGTYGGNIACDNSAGFDAVILGTAAAQTVTVSGNLSFINTNGVTYTIDQDTHNSNLVVGGALTVTQNNAGGTTIWNRGTGNLTLDGNCTGQNLAGTLTYTKSLTGTLTFNGSSDQTVDFNDFGGIEPIIENKTAGRVTLLSNLLADSFTFINGDLDLDAFIFTTADNGNVGIQGDNGARFHNGVDEDMSSGQFVLGASGVLTLDGNGGQLVINNLDFAYNSGSTGTANFCDVINSARTGTGPDLDATAASNNDNGGNTGWDFDGAAADGAAMYHHLQMLGAY